MHSTAIQPFLLFGRSIGLFGSFVIGDELFLHLLFPDRTPASTETIRRDQQPTTADFDARLFVTSRRLS